MPYSSKITDPAFDRYRKNTQNWKFQFSLIIAVLVITSFYFYGEFSNEMDNPEALQIGLGIGLMFLLIGFFSGTSKHRDQTWDGVVVDKKIKKKFKDIGYPGAKADRYVFTIYIKSESGKIYEIRNEDDETVYNYFNVGDNVRYHGNLHSYEKFDKGNDKIIFCNACGFLHDIQENTCLNCGCPLLK